MFDLLRNGLFLSMVCMFSSCGVIDIAKDTKSAVDLTNDQLKKTNELTSEMKKHLEDTGKAIHLQTITVAFQGLLAPENTESLNPPVRMMPYAETLSSEATEDELTKINHLLVVDARFSPPEAKKTRIVSLMASYALGAFTPQEKFDEIVKRQIDAHGRYEESTYYYIVGRYAFIRDFLLGPIVDNSKILNKEMLFEAMEYFRQLRQIAGFSYNAMLNFEIPSLEVSGSVDANEIGAIGKKMRRRFIEKLPLDDQKDPKVQDYLSELIA